MTDREIRAKANAYIEAQLTTMAKYGSAPTLTRKRRAQLLRDVMKPMLALRKAREASQRCRRG